MSGLVLPKQDHLASRIGDSSLAARLRKNLQGEVLFDAFSRGRYSTDASIYQIEPIGVVVPRSAEDVAAAMAIAREEGVPVLPRGAGTSQCGQTVGRALVLDTSRHMKKLLATDLASETVTVEPGIVADDLNAALKGTGYSFPIDISTSSRATIGGMTGNNSCGGRSIKYGIMVDNVLEVDTILADGARLRFGEVGGNLPESAGDPAAASARYAEIVRSLRRLYDSEAAEIAAKVPKLLRKVGGYNLERLGDTPLNLARLLVGSEGTLGFFTRIKLRIHKLPQHKVLAICHFERFYDAMAITRHIVGLGPSAVELVDRTMLDLASEIATFAPTIARAVKGRPEALLLVEFAGDERDPLLAKMKELDELLGDHGFADAIVPALDAPFQAQLAEMRAAGLNIMMSMKGDGKPVSFIEDCAVPLDDLADYTDRLTQVFNRYGVQGTWYAHASVGCLHVRPVLNMKAQGDVTKMRRIAEEAFAMVKEYKGSHSGEHGDGIVRSEFNEYMFGARLTRAFESVKDLFDPTGLLNPGKITRPPLMDDRRLFRYGPDYRGLPHQSSLDWSDWGGFLGAVEMCNNNGHCRRSSPEIMCPSFRATGEEKDLTRGRANSLRLALTGQLGADAFTSDEMKATLDLCVSCKGCRRECPVGVDMAKMKIEFLDHYQQRHGLTLRQKLIANLPRYAAAANRLAPLLNLRDQIPGLATLSEKLFGFSARRPLPRWRRDVHRSLPLCGNGSPVALFVDSFNRYFEPENARAARRVLVAAGYQVIEPEPADRPLCCGRTLLSVGRVTEAREEARRTLKTLAPWVERGVPIIGLEPSCLLTLRDEYPSLLPRAESGPLAARALLLEEFLAEESQAGRLKLALKPVAKTAYLHGHCHQKSFGAMPAVVAALKLVPDLAVVQIESSCCGMAGSFGYEAEHYDLSQAMAERSLLPAVRQAPADALIVADGTSCRHQIAHGSGREALHVARVLERALG